MDDEERTPREWWEIRISNLDILVTSCATKEEADLWLVQFAQHPKWCEIIHVREVV